MPARAGFDYAIVRVVPRIEREEFVNAGVILHARTLRFLGCRIELDRARLAALAGPLDVEAIARHLDAFRAVCDGDPAGGPIAALPMPERFHWLVAPRSTIVQTSPVHGGVCEDPRVALDDIFARRVATAY